MASSHRRSHGSVEASRSILILALAALLLTLGACSSSQGQASLPSPLPTASISRAACDARGRVLDVVSEVKTGAVQSQSDIAARLRDAARRLAAEATRLKSRGLGQTADRVRMLASATTQLADAVDRGDTSAIVTAAARAAGAIASLPGCPSPSPSPTG